MTWHLKFTHPLFKLPASFDVQINWQTIIRNGPVLTLLCLFITMVPVYFDRHCSILEGTRLSGGLDGATYELKGLHFTKPLPQTQITTRINEQTTLFLNQITYKLSEAMVCLFGVSSFCSGHTEDEVSTPAVRSRPIRMRWWPLRICCQSHVRLCLPTLISSCPGASKLNARFIKRKEPGYSWQRCLI